LFLPDFNETLTLSLDFLKLQKVQFHVHLSVASLVVPRGHIDRRTERRKGRHEEDNCRFSQFRWRA